ncbi:unnamed protein product, partial [Chrysoparadoxa australica]
HTCYYAFNATGNAGIQYDTIITATAMDAYGVEPAQPITAMGTIGIANAAPKLDAVVELNDNAVTNFALVEPGGSVTYELTVTNVSPAETDPVTITSVVNEAPGLDSSDCGAEVLGRTLAVRESISCSFTVPVVGPPTFVHRSKVTVDGVDDELQPAVDVEEPQAISISDDIGTMELISSCTPEALGVPGGRVTCKVTVNSLAKADTITIRTLED